MDQTVGPENEGPPMMLVSTRKTLESVVVGGFDGSVWQPALRRGLQRLEA
jgi:hypothetical protein